MSRAQRKDIKQGRTFWIVEPYDGELYTKKVFITRGLRAVWHKWSHRNNQPYIFGYKFVCRSMETIYPDGRREVHPTERDYAFAGVGGWKTKSQKEIERDLYRWLHKENFSTDAGFSDYYWKSWAPGAHVRQMIEEADYHAGDYIHAFFGRKAFTTERSALRYMMRIHNDPLYPKMKEWRLRLQREESSYYYDDVYDYPDAHEPDPEDDPLAEDPIDEQCSCHRCESQREDLAAVKKDGVEGIISPRVYGAINAANEVEAVMNPDLKYDAEDPGSIDDVLSEKPTMYLGDQSMASVLEEFAEKRPNEKVLKLGGTMRVIDIDTGRKRHNDEQEEAGGDTAPT